MDTGLAEELRADSLQLSNSPTGREADLEGEDGYSDEELDKGSDLDWEWQRRRDRFHAMGYRDGLMAGKEACAQQGFNAGFKQSVLAGCHWGLARGVTSSLACLPDDLKERLIQTQEKRDKFEDLYQSVNSLSTADALKLLFHDDIMSKKAVEQSHQPGVAGLGNYTAELQSLFPEIKVQFFHSTSFQPECTF